jgi:hypothetical protein
MLLRQLIHQLKLINMYSKLFTIALATMLSCEVGKAQTAAGNVADDFKPSTFNQPGQEYPQVNSQGYVRFKVKALRQTA